MQKKVYTEDLSLDEILDRLENGEKLYSEDGCASLTYYKKYRSEFIRYCNDIPDAISDGCAIRYTSCPKYFLDEVEEPEADESCIGKLCKFWDSDEDNEDKKVSFLESLDKNYDYIYLAQDGLRYNHCQTLTKEEALALVKE